MGGTDVTRLLRPGRSTRAMLPLAAALACLAAPAAAQSQSGQDIRRLANMSLEELMKADVVSVAGRPGSRMSAPAALTVITAEDVRRSGARNIAEALRLVPGMYVGRINSSSWVVGGRGLGGDDLCQGTEACLDHHGSRCAHWPCYRRACGCTGVQHHRGCFIRGALYPSPGSQP